jgi:hypothetical protein
VRTNRPDPCREVPVGLPSARVVAHAIRGRPFADLAGVENPVHSIISLPKDGASRALYIGGFTPTLPFRGYGADIFATIFAFVS